MKKSFGRLGLTTVLVLVFSFPATGNAAEATFVTNSPAMLTGVGNVSVKPLVTVGDILPGGLKFEGIPDGIAIDPHGGARFDIYVNHELSTVPFGGVVDPINSTVDRLTLRRGSGQIVAAEVVIPSSLNYQRFCSNFFAFTGEDDGGPLLLTNEEATDFVNRTGTAFPGTPGEQAGLVVAYDPATGESRPIYGMGRHNHENSVAIPAYDQAVSCQETTRSRLPLHRCTCMSPTTATLCGTTKARSTVSCPATRRSTTMATSPSVTLSAGRSSRSRRDCQGRPDRSRSVVERQQRIPVHSHRRHCLRPPATKHRLFRRYRRAESHSRPGDWAPGPRAFRHDRPLPEWPHLQDGSQSGQSSQ